MPMPSNMASVAGASAGVGAIHADRGRNLERTRPWLVVEPAREALSRALRESDRPATRRGGPGTAEAG